MKHDLDEMRPFIDYYGAHNISPVAQDISDLSRHFQRRDSLYRSLRIPPRYVRDRSVLEFGPGSGYNSIFTQRLQPRRYLLVDGNPRGVKDTRALLSQMYTEARNFEIVESLIDEFDSPERFDLVLAEGLVPFQRDPSAFVRLMSRFVAEDGILVVTCVDAGSFMGEVGRRLITQRLVRDGESDAELVARLKPIFEPHLKTLVNMTRSAEDWIYDNITIPFVGETFGIDVAIAALDDEFDFLGSSPDFVHDLRWFKQIHGSERDFNRRASRAYVANMLNFFDCRVTVPEHDPGLGIEIRDQCRAIWRQMQEIESSGRRRSAAEAAPAIREVAKLAESTPRAAASLRELADVLEVEPLGDVNAHFREFTSYFGRGLQHVSFLRRGNL